VSCRLHGGVRGPPANFGCWAETKEKGRKEEEDRFEFFEKRFKQMNSNINSNSSNKK
jgi:hypothetical protein